MSAAAADGGAAGSHLTSLVTANTGTAIKRKLVQGRSFAQVPQERPPGITHRKLCKDLLRESRPRWCRAAARNAANW